MKTKDVAASLNHWAELTGMDRRTLQKRLTAVGVRKTKSYRLSDVLRAALSQYGAARTRIAEAGAERAEAENKKRRGEMLDAAEVRDAVASGVATLFAETERLFVNELPPSLVGLDAVAIRARAEQATTEIKSAVREKLNALLK